MVDVLALIVAGAGGGVLGLLFGFRAGAESEARARWDGACAGRDAALAALAAEADRLRLIDAVAGEQVADLTRANRQLERENRELRAERAGR